MNMFHEEHWLRVLIVLYLLMVGTLACGVAIQGRIDVGEHAGEPRQTPCPQGNP